MAGNVAKHEHEENMKIIGRPRRRLENNITMDLKEIYENANRIHLS
jgi:hypothetical protein